MVSKRKQQEFLVALANLKHDPIEQREFLDTWETFIPKGFLSDSPLSRLALADNKEASRGAIAAPDSPLDVENYSLGHLSELSQMLRKAWKERTPERRQYFAYEVSHRFERMYFHDPSEPPRKSPFDSAMAHFSTILDRARRCEHTNCPLPYYIAPNRKPRKYCKRKWPDPASGELTSCAKVMRNALRLKYWDKVKPRELQKRKLERQKKAKRRNIDAKR